MKLERTVLPDDFDQKPVEWNLGIAGIVLTRFGQFLGPVHHLGPDGDERRVRPAGFSPKRSNSPIVSFSDDSKIFR